MTQVTQEVISVIAEELKEDYFARHSIEAYEVANAILSKIEKRSDLDAPIKKYTLENLAVRNLLSLAWRRLKESEPLYVSVGEIVHIPSKVYKEGYEAATILNINIDEGMLELRPTRKRAEVFRASIDYVTKMKLNNDNEQLNLFDSAI